MKKYSQVKKNRVVNFSIATLVLATAMIWNERAMGKKVVMAKLHPKNPCNNNIKIVGEGIASGDLTGQLWYSRFTQGGYSKQDKVFNNTITTDNYSYNAHFIGGFSENNDAFENNIIFENLKDFGIEVRNTLMGGKSKGEGANVHHNNIKITGVDEGFRIGGYVVGGLSINGNTYSNKIILDKAKLLTYNEVVGGDGKLDSHDHEIEITGIETGFELSSSVYGGISETGNVYNNKITLGNVKNIKRSVLGGKSSEKDVYDNAIKITGVKDGFTSTKLISGGYAPVGDSDNNSIILENVKEISGKVKGGDAIKSAYNNKIEISGIKDGFNVLGSLYGGMGKTGNVYNNKITLKDVKNIPGVVSGGKSSEKDVYDNKIEITGVKDGFASTKLITGGYAPVGDSNNNSIILKNVKEISGEITGGDATKSAHNNRVEITGVKDGFVSTKLILGGYASDEDAHNNKVILENVKEISGKVKGGDARKSARNNRVEISGIKDGVINSSYILGGDVGKLGENNTAVLRDITVKNDGKNRNIILGSVLYGGDSSNNKVILDNVKFEGDSSKNIVAGAVTLYAKKSSSKENSVAVAGDTDFTNASLYGATTAGKGYTDFGSKNSNVTFSDNSLNVGYIDGNNVKHAWVSSNEKGNVIPVGAINSFQKVKFDVVKWDEEKAALVIQDKDADLSNLKVEAKGMSFANLDELEAAIRENPSREMYLIDANSTGEKAIKKENISYDEKYTVGTGLEGTAKIEVVSEGEHEGDVLCSIVEEKLKLASKQTHNTVVGQSSGIALVNSSQNLIEEGLNGSTFYATSTGGTEKYETGSHIKTNTWNSIIGLGNVVPVDGGNLGYMVFFEYGFGDYKVENSRGREGRGDLGHEGLALAAKYKLANDFYTEGSVRLGRVKNEARDVLTDGSGIGYNYKTSGLYYGGHIGLGKVVKVSDGISLDNSAKFVYSHIGKDEFEAGGEYKLDAVESKILKASTKLSYGINNLELYLGLGVEHEFDGKAEGTINDIKIKSAEIDGTSVIGEVGVKLMPSPESSWSFDVGAKGYAGEHEGFRGNVGVTFEF